MKHPADLLRELIIIEPEMDVRGLKKIGEEITDELERIPGKLFFTIVSTFLFIIEFVNYN
jgi:hypothetical protein